MKGITPPKGVPRDISEEMSTKGIVNFEDWQNIDLRVAQIKEVEDMEGADKLYKVTLDVGQEIGERVICAGIKEFYSKEDLIGKKIIYFSNLTPRKMRGIESQGMFLAAVSYDSEDKEKDVVLISVEKDIELGSRVS